jgi:hypothetical protein
VSRRKSQMSRRDKFLAFVCVALHFLVLLNVYVADKHTPRVLVIQPAPACARQKPAAEITASTSAVGAEIVVSASRSGRADRHHYFYLLTRDL